jgi:hypothetical protein
VSEGREVKQCRHTGAGQYPIDKTAHRADELIKNEMDMINKILQD